MKLPYKEAIVNGIKGYFQIDEVNTITMPLSMLTDQLIVALRRGYIWI